MAHTIIGIDPGYEGAVAVYEYLDMLDEWVMTAEPMPVITSKAKPRPGKKHMRTVMELDEGAIRDMFSRYDPANTVVFLEKQQAMTRFDPHRWNPITNKPGMNVPPSVNSTWNLAAGYFIVRGILAGLQMSYRLVAPKEWQKIMLAGRDKLDTKVAAAAVCRAMFPVLDLRKTGRCKLPHEGKCDAVLIAMYGYQLLHGKGESGWILTNGVAKMT